RGGVKDTLLLARLLAARLVAFSRVGHSDDNFFVAFPAKLIGDVEMKRVVAALMLAGKAAIDGHARFPVHRPKMQAHMPATPLCWNRYAPPIAKLVGFLQSSHHSRERRINRERHKNLSLIFR